MFCFFQHVQVGESGSVSAQVPVIHEDQVRYQPIASGEQGKPKFQKMKSIQMACDVFKNLIDHGAFHDHDWKAAHPARVVYPAPDGDLKDCSGWFVSELTVGDEATVKNPKLVDLKEAPLQDVSIQLMLG